MVFRLPSHLESLVPIQNSQPTSPAPSDSPWRGEMWVKGMRQDRNHADRIEVTAVEADGDSRMAHWPIQFNVQVYNGSVLHDFKTWMAQRSEIPVCTLLPLRKANADENTVNQSQFRSLSRILAERNTIATASWAPNTHLPPCTLIIYPATNSSAVLVGVLLFSEIPPFINTSYSPITVPIPQRGMPYPPTQRILTAPYTLSPQHHAPSLSPHNSDPNSPVEQPIAAHRQDPAYYQMLSRQGHPSYPNYPPQNPPY
ncbi:hypothetical protein CVT24_007292 [Panaeolus cyanescens]|uniref:Uncharacterized protein n=1 Tax=Panaeolus cyanescens TaxID=181874 RepID=A0A409YPL1_9AGAR|nr:hypothetical protein CVT24_007292 [Panaeolus cyanescens]